jgi:hypothetical protein
MQFVEKTSQPQVRQSDFPYRMIETRIRSLNSVIMFAMSHCECVRGRVFIFITSTNEFSCSRRY